MVQFKDFKSLAAAITKVENHLSGSAELLQQLHPGNMPVIGFTGPPGAGKSSLINALTDLWLQQGKKLGLLLVDPSSPFNYGALLGDRLRLSAHFLNPNLYIRSISSRGSLGGLSDSIVEVLEVMRAADFDLILIETVGVGQSEVEIAGLADLTVVVLVPESGDAIQAMKAGLMEIADLFCINKADRELADQMVHALQNQLAISHRDTEVMKTTATEGKGVEELAKAILQKGTSAKNLEKKSILSARKALQLIRQFRTRDIRDQDLIREIQDQMRSGNFQLFRYIQKYIS